MMLSDPSPLLSVSSPINNIALLHKDAASAGNAVVSTLSGQKTPAAPEASATAGTKGTGTATDSTRTPKQATGATTTTETSRRGKTRVSSSSSSSSETATVSKSRSVHARAKKSQQRVVEGKSMLSFMYRHQLGKFCRIRMSIVVLFLHTHPTEKSSKTRQKETRAEIVNCRTTKQQHHQQQQQQEEYAVGPSLCLCPLSLSSPNGRCDPRHIPLLSFAHSFLSLSPPPFSLPYAMRCPHCLQDPSPWANGGGQRGGQREGGRKRTDRIIPLLFPNIASLPP